MGRINLLALFFLAAILSITYVSACGYDNPNDCKVTETIVKGRIYFADTNQSAGNADVTITCSHNGTDYTKTAKSVSTGFLKGTYFVIFPQAHCVAGDEVTVSAVKDGSTGEEDGTIRNWITTRCLDMDIGIINVPLVPEFGFIIGGLTLVSAIAILFFVRRL